MFQMVYYIATMVILERWNTIFVKMTIGFVESIHVCHNSWQMTNKRAKESAVLPICQSFCQFFVENYRNSLLARHLSIIRQSV